MVVLLFISVTFRLVVSRRRAIFCWNFSSKDGNGVFLNKITLLSVWIQNISRWDSYFNPQAVAKFRWIPTVWWLIEKLRELPFENALSETVFPNIHRIETFGFVQTISTLTPSTRRFVRPCFWDFQNYFLKNQFKSVLIISDVGRVRC